MHKYYRLRFVDGDDDPVSWSATSLNIVAEGAAGYYTGRAIEIEDAKGRVIGKVSPEGSFVRLRTYSEKTH